MPADDIYNSVVEYNDSNFKQFSTIVRSLFDDAVNMFEDKSIDLLHIDGIHTYDDTKHDFDTWIGKMSDRGIVIFHDVNCLGNEKAFTTHLFWDEIRAKYPSFTFAVGPGLGILAAGNEIPDPLKFILSADADTAEKIQSIFGNRGMSLKRLFDSQLLHHDYLITLLKLTAPARFVNRKLMRFRPYRKLVTRVFRRG